MEIVLKKVMPVAMIEMELELLLKNTTRFQAWGDTKAQIIEIKKYLKENFPDFSLYKSFCPIFVDFNIAAETVTMKVNVVMVREIGKKEEERKEGE